MKQYFSSSDVFGLVKEMKNIRDLTTMIWHISADDLDVTATYLRKDSTTFFRVSNDLEVPADDIGAEADEDMVWLGKVGKSRDTKKIMGAMVDGAIRSEYLKSVTTIDLISAWATEPKSTQTVIMGRSTYLYDQKTDMVNLSTSAYLTIILFLGNGSLQQVNYTELSDLLLHGFVFLLQSGVSLTEDALQEIEAVGAGFKKTLVGELKETIAKRSK